MKKCIMSHKCIVLFGIIVLLIYADINISYGQENGKIYWTEWHKIRRANLDGTNVEDVVTDRILVSRITLDSTDGKMYWIEDFGRKIMRANFDGSDIETIHNIKENKFGTVRIMCMAVDGKADKIYWTGIHFPKPKILRSNLDGTNIKEFPINGKFVGTKNMELDPKEGKIYWVNFSLFFISRTNFDGTDIEDLVFGIGSNGLALDLEENMMYWSNALSGTIQKAFLNGDKVEDTVTRLRFPTEIALDKRSRKIYWVEPEGGGKGKIRSANLDGTDVIDVLTGLLRLSDVAIHNIGPYDVSSDIHKLTTTWANIKVQ